MIQSYGGSFQGFIEEFLRRYNGKGTAIQLVKMVTDTFPCFRDETWFEGKRGKFVCGYPFWPIGYDCFAEMMLASLSAYMYSQLSSGRMVSQ